MKRSVTPLLPAGYPAAAEQRRRGQPGLDGVPGGCGGVGAPSWGGPAVGAVGELVDVPSGVLLEPWSQGSVPRESGVMVRSGPGPGVRSVRGERVEVLVLVRLGRAVLLAHPVQPRLAFLRRHRVPVQPARSSPGPGS